MSSTKGIPRWHREEKYCYLAEFESKFRPLIQPSGKMLQFKFDTLQADLIQAISWRRHLSCLPNFSKWISNDLFANQVDFLHTCNFGNIWTSNFGSSHPPAYNLCCHQSQASSKLELQWKCLWTFQYLLTQQSEQDPFPHHYEQPTAFPPSQAICPNSNQVQHAEKASVLK